MVFHVQTTTPFCPIVNSLGTPPDLQSNSSQMGYKTSSSVPMIDFHFRRNLIFVLLFLSLIAVVPAEAAKKTSRKFYVTARGAVLIDSTNGKSLFSKNANKKILPASTTKVMTALLVLEKLSLDSYVTVSQRAPGMQPSK